MTIHLPEDLENSVRAEVLNGHFASEDALIAEAVRTYLRQRRDESPEAEETAFDALSRLGLIGCLKGGHDTPTDLSTNPIHMQGFGRA